MVAGLQLLDDRADLPAGESAADPIAERRRHQAPAARSLGYEPGAFLHLRACLTTHSADGSGMSLLRRPRSRRSGAGCGRLAGGYVQRDLSGRQSRLGRDAPAVPPVLLPRRRAEPRVRADPGLYSRRWRTRLRPRPRLRCRDGQPRPLGYRRGRRRRGRDRAPGRVLERHLVPRPHPRWGRAADPAPQRRQDLRPNGPRPQATRGGARAAVRTRLPGDRSDRGRPGRHVRFAQALADAHSRIRDIQTQARGAGGVESRPTWPLLVLRTPKGWTGPATVDGIRVIGTYRSHQVPLAGVKNDPDHRALLEEWLRSYRPEELFDGDGSPNEQVRSASASGGLRMSATPYANGGLLTRDLDLPDFRNFAVTMKSPGMLVESTRRLGQMCAEIYRRNPDNFRLFCPDETNSNRLGAVFEASDRGFMERVGPDDTAISQHGRVMEVLSEHNCHGWLEGYTLTGRHGLFATYEAFAMVSASQTVQHSKWLEEAGRLPWRARVPSLNILLTSTAWRNDHNGFYHQGPGLIQTMITHRGDVSRVYLPPDANCLLSVANHCLRSRSYVNLIVIDKQPQPQWLSIDEAIEHCRKGAGIWPWAGTDDFREDPDIVLACAGDIVTMETVAAAEILRERLPHMRVRVVNVVDLMCLPRPQDHPHGLAKTYFQELFTDHVDVIFTFHGFPGAIHQLVHGRPDADRIHVRGFIEQGTTTTPFDMTVKNKTSRYHLVMDAISRASRTPAGATDLMAWCRAQLEAHEAYVVEHLEDMPEIREWRWQRPLTTVTGRQC